MKTFSVLASMQTTLEQFLSQIIPHIRSSIQEANNDLVTHSLAILKQAFRNSDPQALSDTAQAESSSISQFLNEALHHS